MAAWIRQRPPCSAEAGQGVPPPPQLPVSSAVRVLSCRVCANTEAGQGRILLYRGRLGSRRAWDPPPRARLAPVLCSGRAAAPPDHLSGRTTWCTHDAPSGPVDGASPHVEQRGREAHFPVRAPRACVASGAAVWLTPRAGTERSAPRSSSRATARRTSQSRVLRVKGILRGAPSCRRS